MSSGMPQKDKNNLVLQQRFLLETPMLLPEVKVKKEVKNGQYRQRENSEELS